MKSIEKLEWLSILETKTEGYIQDAVNCFQNLDECILDEPSETGGWSIAQCLCHLNTYGNYYLPWLRKGIEQHVQKRQSDQYISSWLGTYLIRLTDPKTGSKKLKAVKKHQPNKTLPAHQIVAEFIEQQETMLQLLRKARQINVNEYRIPLSIASWIRLPLGDIMHFMVAHNERHMMQAKRNLQPVQI